MNLRESVLERLKDLKVCQCKKQVKLKNGEISDIYFDFRNISSKDPKVFHDICFLIAQKIRRDVKSTHVSIAGVPLGGIPYAVTIAGILKAPFILIRDQVKNHGIERGIEIESGLGEIPKRLIVLIEDVVTTGQSVRETIQKINKGTGDQVIATYCIVDRRAQQSSQAQQSFGENERLTSLFQMDDFQKPILKTPQMANNPYVQKLLDIKNQKKSNIVASLDFTDPNRILSSIEKIGPYICGVKLHIDILDSSKMPMSVFCKRLHELAEQFYLFLIEDRKLADIPYISALQLDRIPAIFDAVTVHAISGPALTRELNKRDRGILLIHEMSTEENLIDFTYSNHVLEMCFSAKNLVGLVSQTRVLDMCLIFTPGVTSSSTPGVLMGQHYKQGNKTQSDFFIIGRSIYESPDMIQTTKKLRDSLI